MNRGHCGDPRLVLGEQQHFQRALPWLPELRTQSQHCWEGTHTPHPAAWAVQTAVHLKQPQHPAYTPAICSIPHFRLGLYIKGCFLSGKLRWQSVFSWNSTCQTLYSPGTLLHTFSCQNVKLLIWAFFSFSCAHQPPSEGNPTTQWFPIFIFLQEPSSLHPSSSWGLFSVQMTFVVRVTIYKETWIQCLLWLAFISQCSSVQNFTWYSTISEDKGGLN